MTVITILAKGMMYLALAVITGYWLLRLFPEGRKPKVQLPIPVLTAAYLLLPLTLLVPPVQLGLEVASLVEERFWPIFWNVLRQFEMGDAFFATLFLCAGLAVFHWNPFSSGSRWYTWTGFLFATSLILAQSWGSHAASVTEYLGFFAQFFHVLSISLWIGPLFLIAWFGRDFSHWPAFLGWYTPLAMLCVATIITTGILMMTFIVPQPVQSLILPYGQTLLFKHLLLLPVLLLGLLHSWLTRQLHHRFPRRLTGWLKAESTLALLIFAVTAGLSQEAPPHDQLDQAVKYAGISPLFRLFLPEVTEAGRLTVHLHLGSAFLLLGALGTALFIIRHRQRSLPLTLLACAILILLLYLAVMLSLEGAPS